jgi:hypothetical protein
MTNDVMLINLTIFYNVFDIYSINIIINNIISLK